MTDMVERVARALHRNDFTDQAEADRIWNEELEPDDYKDSYRRQARVAIAAMQSEGVSCENPVNTETTREYLERNQVLKPQG
jgi:hypothetical protein